MKIYQILLLVVVLLDCGCRSFPLFPWPNDIILTDEDQHPVSGASVRVYSTERKLATRYMLYDHVEKTQDDGSIFVAWDAPLKTFALCVMDGKIFYAVDCRKQDCKLCKRRYIHRVLKESSTLDSSDIATMQERFLELGLPFSTPTIDKSVLAW